VGEFLRLGNLIGRHAFILLDFGRTDRDPTDVASSGRLDLADCSFPLDRASDRPVCPITKQHGKRATPKISCQTIASRGAAMSMSSPKPSPIAMLAQFGTYPSRAKTVGAAVMVWIALLFFQKF